jgi:hypothetical protein
MYQTVAQHLGHPLKERGTFRGVFAQHVQELLFTHPAERGWLQANRRSGQCLAADQARPPDNFSRLIGDIYFPRFLTQCKLEPAFDQDNDWLPSPEP